MKIRIISIMAILIAGLMTVNAASSCCCQCYGLTPGYWKNHVESWPISSTATFQSIGINAPGTLLDALNYRGDGDMEHILLRAAAAAYLNAMSSNTNFGKFAPGLIYPASTDDVRFMTNTALANGDRGFMENMKNQLELYNQLGD